jgi:hypothetical protein
LGKYQTFRRNEIYFQERRAIPIVVKKSPVGGRRGTSRDRVRRDV